jgi:hypothetical protein
MALGRDNCHRAAGLNAVDQIVGIAALVGQYRIGFQAFQQRVGLRNIGHLATSRQPTHRFPERIDRRVNLACPSAARAAYRL